MYPFGPPMGVPIVNMQPGFVVTTPPTVMVTTTPQPAFVQPMPQMMTTTTYQQPPPQQMFQQTTYAQQQAPPQQSVFNTNYQAPPAMSSPNPYATQAPPQNYNQGGYGQQQQGYNQGYNQQSQNQGQNYSQQSSYNAQSYSAQQTNFTPNQGQGSYQNQSYNQGYNQQGSATSTYVPPAQNQGYNNQSQGYGNNNQSQNYDQGYQAPPPQQQAPPQNSSQSPFSTNNNANYGAPTRALSQGPSSWQRDAEPNRSASPQYTTQTTYETPQNFVVPEQAPPQRATPPPAQPSYQPPAPQPAPVELPPVAQVAIQPPAASQVPVRQEPLAAAPKKTVAPPAAAAKKFLTPGQMKGPTVSSHSASGGQHTYSKEEVRSFSDYINQLLSGDADLKNVLPLDTDSEALFEVAANSVLLCKLINGIKPGTIDERKIVTKPNMSQFEKIQNHDLAIRGAKDLGCNIVNIGGMDLMEQKPYLMLGLVWQVLEKGLMSKISLDVHPELISMLDANEDLESFANRNPTENLLRWFNFHLNRAGAPRRVNNFSGDIADGENYLTLLSQIAPNIVPREAANEQDPRRRAELVCEYARKMDALRFVTPEDILAGNGKLNLAFTAFLFHKYPGLDATQDNRRLEEAERVMREKYAREDAERKARWEAEEESRRKRWESEEEERRARIAEEEETMRKRWAEEEAALKAKLNEEERRKREEMLRAEQELRARQEASEAQARAQAEERRRAEMAAEQARLAEEDRRRRWEAEQAMQQRMLAEEESRRRAEEARRQEEMRRRAWEEEQRRQEAERQRQAAEAEAARLRAWDDYNAKQTAMQEEMRKQAWAQYHAQQTMVAQQQILQQQTTVTTTAIPIATQTTVVTTSVFPIPRLHVTICRGRRLIPTGVVLLPDPYVWCSRGPERYKTHHIASSQDPVWNTPFEFRFVNEFDEVVIDVYDHNLVGKDKFMGQVRLNKNDFALLGERWYPLRSRTYKSDVVHGEVLIDIGASA